MAEKRKPGRPPIPASQRKRRNFTFRVNDALRDRLVALADEQGWSVSEVVTLIIHKHFDREAMLDDLRRVLKENERNSVIGRVSDTWIVPYTADPGR